MNSLWDILSVAIGVSFVFLILSILNSWVQEYIATAFSLRASHLADVLQNMLEPEAEKLNGLSKVYTPFSDSKIRDRSGKLIPKNLTNRLSRIFGKKTGKKVSSLTKKAVTHLANRTTTRRKLDPPKQHKGTVEEFIQKLNENPVRFFYEHPIIYSLSKPGALPGYIPTNDFTVALFDMLNKIGLEKPVEAGTPLDEITLDNLKKGIDKLNGPLKDRLVSLMYSAQINTQKTVADIEDFRNAINTWFDATMDRGKGWYKRKMQFIGILCGVVLAILLNADTVSLSNALWQNAALRESVSQAAVTYAQQGNNANAEQAKQQLLNLNLPIGWSFRFADQDPSTIDNPRDFPSAPGGWVAKAIGLLLTGFAISQGSQIWFDLMNRLINLRSTGLKPEPEEQAPAKAG